MKKLTKNDVEIIVSAEYEYMPIEGFASAIDEETDARIAAEIREQLESGNVWAWCFIRVAVEYEGIVEETFLGGCSYKSEEDFIENSGYYDDMVAECLDALNKRVQAIVAAVA